jgi:hypothetical protein
MPIEALTYAALGARLGISPAAARSLAKRLRLPCSLSDDGRALVSVDPADIKHTPRRRIGSSTDGTVRLLTAELAASQAEVARLERIASAHRADFERERERADRLMIELSQANAEAMAAREAKARLEGSLQIASRTGHAIDGRGPTGRRLGHLAAELVAADRKGRGP